MPGLRDLLDRFRPAGAPGAATGAGVPVDRRADATRELEPVFAALSDVESECAGLRLAARDRAARQVAEAGELARGVVARARAGAPAERAAVATRQYRRTEVDVAAIAAAATRTAEQVRARAARELPGLVDRVLDRVRTELDELEQSVAR